MERGEGSHADADQLPFSYRWVRRFYRFLTNVWFREVNVVDDDHLPCRSRARSGYSVAGGACGGVAGTVQGEGARRARWDHHQGGEGEIVVVVRE